GLADMPRKDEATKALIEPAMCRIWNRLRQCVDTPWVWTLEDDIIPPDDVVRQLLWCMTPSVGCVTSPYKSRFHDGYIGQEIGEDGQSRRMRPPETGTTSPFEAAGFGCLLM